jgi:SnoaL-like domain
VAMILPRSLVAYLNSEAMSDVESLANCFAADAVVHDEGRAIRGLDAIKAWKKDAKAKYQYTYRFVLVNDKIARLEIR